MARNAVADFSDGSSIIIVVAKYEVRRDRDSQSEVVEELRDGTGLPDVATNKQDLEIFAPDIGVEKRPALR